MASPVVELTEARRYYTTRAGHFDALRKTTLTIARGELIGLVGPSGSGKSTLLNLVGGIDRPSAGRVVVDGHDLTAISDSDLARLRGRNIGVVFQFFALIPTLSAEENLLLAMDLVGKIPARERRERARAALEQLGLGRHAAKLPASLSGGEQQRVAIARAMVNDPAILIADEPTGNLDSENGAMIDAIFAECANRGRTVIVATHDTTRLDRYHRLVRLADGQITSDQLQAAA